jgi:hypothetical protein
MQERAQDATTGLGSDVFGEGLGQGFWFEGHVLSFLGSWPPYRNLISLLGIRTEDAADMTEARH